MRQASVFKKGELWTNPPAKPPLLSTLCPYPKGKRKPALDMEKHLTASLASILARMNAPPASIGESDGS